MVHRGDIHKRTSPLFYELGEEAARQFDKVAAACQNLARARVVWRMGSREVTPDWKRNSGAASLISRSAVRVERASAPWIATDVATWSIDLGVVKLYFFPDRLFVWVPQVRSRFLRLAPSDFCARQIHRRRSRTPRRRSRRPHLAVRKQRWQPRPAFRGQQTASCRALRISGLQFADRNERSSTCFKQTACLSVCRGFQGSRSTGQSAKRHNLPAQVSISEHGLCSLPRPTRSDSRQVGRASSD